MADKKNGRYSEIIKHCNRIKVGRTSWIGIAPSVADKENGPYSCSTVGLRKTKVVKDCNRTKKLKGDLGRMLYCLWQTWRMDDIYVRTVGSQEMGLLKTTTE